MALIDAVEDYHTILRGKLNGTELTGADKKKAWSDVVERYCSKLIMFKCDSCQTIYSCRVDILLGLKVYITTVNYKIYMFLSCLFFLFR